MIQFKFLTSKLLAKKQHASSVFVFSDVAISYHHIEKSGSRESRVPFNDFIRFPIVKQNGHPISGRQESNREFSAAFLASKYGPRIFGKTWCVVSANRIIRLKSRFSSRPGMSSYTCFFLYKDFLKLIV